MVTLVRGMRAGSSPGRDLRADFSCSRKRRRTSDGSAAKVFHVVYGVKN